MLEWVRTSIMTNNNDGESFSLENMVCIRFVKTPWCMEFYLKWPTTSILKDVIVCGVFYQSGGCREILWIKNK